ncbi:MAG: hypothetical protein NT075_29345 [Chloroflexi bacterium]|nr:hypothetical protein [Chloroflexota bacterium]
MDDNQDKTSSEVHTGGGPYVGKDVTTGRDFVGRDVHITHNYHQPSSITVVSLITGVVLISAAIFLYWLITVKNQDLQLAPTQALAIAQQTTSTATQVSLTTTVITPTETPMLLATSSPVADVAVISVSLTIPVETTLPATTAPESNYPCEATVIDPNGGQQVTFLYEFKEGEVKRKVKPLAVGIKVSVIERSSKVVDEVRYHIKAAGGIDFGWIPDRYLELATSCPQISN